MSVLKTETEHKLYISLAHTVCLDIFKLYSYATTKPHDYLVKDMKQSNLDEFRFRAYIFRATL